MKAPRRLSQDTTDPAVRELLGSWRRAPTAGSKAEAWSRLAPTVGAGVGVVVVATANKAAVHATSAGAALPLAGATAGATTAVTPTVATWVAATTLKWIAAGAMASVVIVTAAVSVVAPVPRADTPASVAASATPAQPPRSVAGRPPLPRVVPVPPQATPGSIVATVGPTAPLAPPISRADVPASSRDTTSAPAPASPRAPSSADDGSIAPQLAALDDARDAVTHGDPRRALRALDAYDARFPGGALSQEATLVRVRALLAVGDRAAATTVGRRFVEEHPSSPYAAQVHQMLGSTRDANQAITAP